MTLALLIGMVADSVWEYRLRIQQEERDWLRRYKDLNDL
jgi:hypothetical protein